MIRWCHTSEMNKVWRALSWRLKQRQSLFFRYENTSPLFFFSAGSNDSRKTHKMRLIFRLTWHGSPSQPNERPREILHYRHWQRILPLG